MGFRMIMSVFHSFSHSFIAFPLICVSLCLIAVENWKAPSSSCYFLSHPSPLSLCLSRFIYRLPRPPHCPLSRYVDFIFISRVSFVIIPAVFYSFWPWTVQSSIFNWLFNLNLKRGNLCVCVYVCLSGCGCACVCVCVCLCAFTCVSVYACASVCM